MVLAHIDRLHGIWICCNLLHTTPEPIEDEKIVDLIPIVTQPLVVLSAAIALFLGRTLLHARRLKTAARDPDLARIMTAGQSENLLKTHEKSLNHAKSETRENLTQAQRILHEYSRDFKRSKSKKSSH
jgi:hypothetical protein